MELSFLQIMTVKRVNQLKQNNNVCLSFFWPSLEKQLIINGICSKISEEDSDDYFYSRPR